jgi:hypothetical protein
MQRGFLKLQKTRLRLPTVVVICCLVNLFPKWNAARHCLPETLFIVKLLSFKEKLHGLRRNGWGHCTYS